MRGKFSTKFPQIPYSIRYSVLFRTARAVTVTSSVFAVLNTFTFMHSLDAFIQSDLQCIQVIQLLSVHVFPGNWTHNLCAANAMLYHWATGTRIYINFIRLRKFFKKNTKNGLLSCHSFNNCLIRTECSTHHRFRLINVLHRFLGAERSPG